ncbi:hypothetical protein BGZ68_000911, partial [Mortierella alpina]
MRLFLSTLLAAALLGTMASADVHQRQQADLGLERDHTDHLEFASYEHNDLDNSRHFEGSREKQRRDQETPSIAPDFAVVDVAAVDVTPAPVTSGANTEADTSSSKVSSRPKHPRNKNLGHHYKNDASRHLRHNKRALELQRKKANHRKRSLWHDKKAAIPPKSDQTPSNKKGDSSHVQSTPSHEEQPGSLTSAPAVLDGTFTAQDSQP